MMTKTLVWTQFAMKEGLAPKPPEFYVNEGDRLELYVVTKAKTEPPAWDGEGDKPPVGSRCMKDHAEVLVIAHVNVGSLYDPAVVYQPINHPMGIDWKVSNVFSPIRSEEDRAVEEMYEAATGDPLEGDEMDDADAVSVCRELYRAGYRKTGGE